MLLAGAFASIFIYALFRFLSGFPAASVTAPPPEINVNPAIRDAGAEGQANGNGETSGQPLIERLGGYPHPPVMEWPTEERL